MSLTVLPPVDQVNDLVARARERGAVAMTEITAAFEGSDLPADAADSIVRLLADEGVEVLDAPPDEVEERRSGRSELARRAVTADQARTIRIPVHMVETINKMARIQRQLHQDLGREALPEEIAREMGLSLERVAEIQRIAQEPISLQSPIGEEDSDLGDFIEDADAVVPIEAAAFIMLQEQLDSVLDNLSVREQRIIQLRFGLTDGHPRTLEEVGREFGVTRERIRQIESKTLAKLRHPSRDQMLKEYLG